VSHGIVRHVKPKNTDREAQQTDVGIDIGLDIESDTRLAQKRMQRHC
jgi:hypothetical protein